MENLTTKIDDLERTNEHLKKEFCNQEVILEQYKNELMEKEKENIKLKEKLDKVRQNKRKLEIFAEKKMEVIKQISEQKQELEESLNEAKINDLLRNERYKGILQELEVEKLVQFLKTFDRCWNKIQKFSEFKSLVPRKGCDGRCGNVPDC
ncbi:puff II/9-2 protein-like [Palaemon carinicauda]|uniref:puff II/9-2 protein-like n=1 Tax=Palaemon carinicauda TaxID=392227 RepID=UPI0035B6045D